MMQAIFNHPLGRTILIFSGIFLSILLLGVLLAPLLVPIILSFALYALLEPISEILERQGFTRNTASLSVLLILLTLAALLIYAILPQLSGQLTALQTQLPQVWQSITSMSDNFSQNLLESFKLHNANEGITQQIFAQANDWGKTALIQGSNLIISFSALVIIVPIFTFFLVRDYRSFRNYMLDKLPNSSFEMGWLIYHRVAHQLQEYIRGIMIQSGIICVITSFGFYLIGLDSPFLLGIIAGILNLIPYIGPLLAMILPVLLALGKVPIELWLIGAAIGVILIAQIIDNLIVIPSVIANSVNLHPLIVIVGIIVFGNLFGFIGMVIAIPMISTANIIYTGLYNGIKTRHEIQHRVMTTQQTENE